MTIIFQPIRQRVLRRRQEIEGVLGDGNGNVYAGKSRYYVRLTARTDDSGNVTYGTPLPIRYAAASSVLPIEGVEVLLKVDYDNELSIMRIKPDYCDRADIDSRTFNQAEPIDKFVYFKNAVRWMARFVGSVNGATSTLLTVRENPFVVNDYLDWSTYGGTPRAADKVDLASYVPAADLQCLVIVFFDTFLAEPLVVASTAQALTTDIDSTDWDECFAQLEHNEYIPLLAVNLADAQTAIDNNDIVEDLRQFVNTPKIMGNPNPMPTDKAYLIRNTHQFIAYDLAIEGEFVLEGDMTVN